MRLEDNRFPVYRRYENGKNFFKIINAETFEEIQLIGSRKVIKTTHAKVFPERNFIRDLVEGKTGVIISEEEYERMRSS